MAKTKAAKKSIKRVSVQGMSFVRELGGISEYRLDKNGLQILLVPDATVPVVGVMVTYRVGSRNEATGYTGSAHLLEHLLFKGSKNFNEKKGGVFPDRLDAEGARINAITWCDRTNYYEILPKEMLEKTLAFEADRMVNAFIRESDRVTEMPIVRSEFEIHENHPVQALDTQIWALAYQAHPYHHTTIGWRSDIENVPIERLERFYKDFYRPDNATLTVIGDINETETLKTIEHMFGKNKNPISPMPAVYTTEPKQEGERRAIVKREGDTNMIGIAHKIPAVTHEDIPALMMLQLVLGEGKTSRFYKAFVDSGKATDLSVVCSQLRDPSLFFTYISLTPAMTHEAAETLIKKILNEVASRGVSVKELAHAKQSIRAYLAARRDGPYAFLSSINEEIASADWTRFFTFPEELQKVTVKEIQAVAKKYFTDDQSTIVYFKSAKV